MNKIVLTAILLVFLAAFAHASVLSGSFEVSCDCLVPGEMVFTLLNDSGTTQHYTISSVGENNEWINLNGTWTDSTPLSITLSAGESKNIYAFVKPQTCYISPGTYTVTVQAYSEDASIVQPITVTVRPSRLLEISLETETIELKQCEQKTLEMNIKNTGKSDELIFLEAVGIPENWIGFSDNEFLLEKTSSKQMNLTVKPDCGAETKNYDFQIRAKILNTGFSTAKNLSLNIVDAQEIEISSASMNSCAEKQTESNISIKNNGRLEDTLKLSITGPDWIKLGQEEITLLAGEEKNIKVKFEKTSAAAKDYAFTLKADSKIFGKTTEKEFSVSLQDCYGITISNILANGQTGHVEACIEEPLNYTFELLNDRAEPIEVDVSLRGVNAEVSPSKAAISAGTSQLFTATIDLGNESIGAKTFELLVKSDFFSSSQEFDFDTVDCYALEVDYNGLGRPVDVNADKSKSERNPYTVRVKNIGTKQVSVTANVMGENWVYFQPDSFTLNSGEQKEIYLYFDPHYDTREGVYENTLQISAQYFTDKKQTTVTVYGGLYSIIGEASVSADGELNRLIEQVDKTVKIDLAIKNDSNSFLRIDDFNAFGYNADFEFAPRSLAPEETMEVLMTLYLGQGFEKTQFTVPVRIITDKGTIVRDIQVDLNAPQKPIEFPLSGFVALGDIKDMVLIGLIIVVLALALVMIFRAGSKGREEKKEETIESYWQPPEEKKEDSIQTGSLKAISREVKSKPKAKTAKKTVPKAKKSTKQKKKKK